MTLATIVCVLALASSPDRFESLSDTYVEAIETINSKHLRKPGKTKEAELAKKLPKKASVALSKLLEAKPGNGMADAVERCAAAALDLDRVDDFNAARSKLLELDAMRGEDLGVALSRERVLLLGEGGLDV